MIGRSVGDYRLTRVLGEGGMGVVFEGYHERLEQQVAVKMLHPSLMMDRQAHSRFVREAQALARLNHPNIVRLLNFLNTDDGCFIVMEFVDGRTIEEVMASTGLVPAKQAAEYFVQVLAAVRYAHSLGIIHRDIKPPNICVLEGGQVKLLDFGTAKVLGAQALTQDRMTIGTLVYMSPEQVCGRPLDFRSDIYSLGVTIYEMVTGKLPHESDDEMDLIQQIVNAAAPPPSQHYPYVPKALEAIILRAIQKNPAKRFQSAEEFLLAIRDYMQGGSGKPGTLVREVGSGGRLQTLAWICVVAGVLLVAGGIVSMVLRMHVLGGIALGAGGAAAIVGLALRFGRRGQDRPLPVPGGQPDFDQEVTMDGRSAQGQFAQAAPPPPTGQPAEVSGQVEAGVQADVHAEHTSPLLYVYEGPDKGRSWPLPRGAITIGRGPHNTIVLSDSSVSTTHAQIGFDGQQYVFADLESRNGSYVNNHRVKSVVLHDRDVIVIGGSHMAIAFQ